MSAKEVKGKKFKSCCYRSMQEHKSGNQTVPIKRHIWKGNHIAFPPLIYPQAQILLCCSFFLKKCCWFFLKESKHALHGLFWILTPKKETDKILSQKTCGVRLAEKWFKFSSNSKEMSLQPGFQPPFHTENGICKRIIFSFPTCEKHSSLTWCLPVFATAVISS